VASILCCFPDDLVWKVRDEVVYLVIVGTIRAPDTLPFRIVETEALGARHERVQKTLGLANILSCLQVVQVGGQRSLHIHWHAPGYLRCQHRADLTVTRVSGATVSIEKIGHLGNNLRIYCASSQSSSDPSLTPSNNGVDR